MKREVFDRLCGELVVPSNATTHLEKIAKQWGISYDELSASCSQETQALVIQAHSWVRSNTPQMVDRYVAGEPLLNLACWAQCPPCLFARRLLESTPGIDCRQKSTKVLRNPGLLDALPESEATPEGTAAVQHVITRLRADIIQAAKVDTLYSPQSDIVRHVHGIEYEALLCEKLRNAGVPFISETVLREQGFFKTPDIKLQIPIMLCGRVVNWIDSKATFGSRRSHMLQREAQFLKYVNRFGPGAVIYWFGFVEDLADTDADILLLERFPLANQILQLHRLPVVASA